MFKFNRRGSLYVCTTISMGGSGATTFSITTLSITTLTIKGLFVTLSITTFSINDTQHNSTLSFIVLNVAFDLLLC